VQRPDYGRMIAGVVASSTEAAIHERGGRGAKASILVHVGSWGYCALVSREQRPHPVIIVVAKKSNDCMANTIIQARLEYGIWNEPRWEFGASQRIDRNVLIIIAYGNCIVYRQTRLRSAFAEWGLVQRVRETSLVSSWTNSISLARPSPCHRIF